MQHNNNTELLQELANMFSNCQFSTKDVKQAKTDQEVIIGHL